MIDARIWLGVGVFLLGANASALAATRYVDAKSAKPEAPFATKETAAKDIQSAVDAAEAGDTIEVAAGTYLVEQTIVVKQAIVVRGAGAEVTKIDAGGKCRVVTLNGGATFRGFTVTGGQAVEGGGVACGNGVTLAECTIEKNAAQRFGGGVSCRVAVKKGKDPMPCVVRDCKIVGNKVTLAMHTDTPWGGGGIYSTAHASIKNCRIEGNEAAQRGGGIYAHEFQIVENCTIVGNVAHGKRQPNPNGPGSMDEGGGGAYCDFGARLQNCLLSGNHAKIGGGAVLSTGASAKSCTIAANSADLSGGGFHTMGKASIVNSILSGNVAGKDKSPDDLFVSHYYHVDIHQLTLGVATVSNSCIEKSQLHVTKQSFYLGRTAKYDPAWYKNALKLNACIEKEPMFVDRAKRDFRLKPGSPCIDAGRKEDWMDAATDLAGQPRLRGTAPDIGAYETTPAKAAD